MKRYISIFILSILLGLVLLGFLIPLMIGIDSVGEVDTVIGILCIFFGSFIITQLFYIIDLIKKQKS
ncbi:MULTISPECIES: hypothetical protein [Niallia]|uniref:Uncharacterized protein n=1 Tax=Niallia circulans TaxID=1397 RepID=A0A553SND6_NIACI|nr:MULTISPECIES: hypothetical protein [Niallia]MCT2346313.1 hypothetical protein [Niallia taxi]MED3964940.1 hypothetical protein [Niallia taxi]TRZ38505.1 hypothetical protein CEQ21_24265 [Niallia circulans]WOD61907.1 hypothetical protein NQZ71_13935 [Niallia taxi]